MKLRDSRESREIYVVRIDPDINLKNNYFVGVWQGDRMFIVKGAYNTLGELKEGYEGWVRYARLNKNEIPIILQQESGEIRDIDISKNAPELRGLVEKVLSGKSEEVRSRV